MKRGLKVHVYTDSESGDMVATYAPMKRGLKGTGRCTLAVGYSGSNLCPDEKGTESEDNEKLGKKIQA